MATQTTTQVWLSDLDSWTGVADSGDSTLQWQSGDGTPANGCIESVITGRNSGPDDNYFWKEFAFDTDLSIPSDQKIDSIQLKIYYKTTAYDTVDAVYDGPHEIRTTGDALVATSIAQSANISSETGWTQRTGSDEDVSAQGWLDSDSVRIRLNNHLDLGNSKTAAATLRNDYLEIIVTHSDAGADNVVQNVI